MKKILMTIDHKWRDLASYVYVGWQLERLGYEVTYVRNGLEKYFIPGVKPDLVLLVHLYEENKRKFVKELKNQGIMVALLPTEGIPTLDKYKNFAGGRDLDLSDVDLHFVWNEPMADVLKQNTSLPDFRIKIVGVPRFDFYRPPVSKFLMSKNDFCKKYLLDPDPPIITFATNFTQSQFYERNREFFIKDTVKLGIKTVLDEISGKAEDIPKRDFESREILMSAFIQLVKEKKDVNFILKLHPSEDHQFYRRLLNSDLKSEQDRIRIISNEYIWDVLNATDIELKRSCTTGVESWILGKPTLEMRLNPDEWYVSNNHASGSDVVTTYKEMLECINSYLDGKAVDKLLTNKRKLFIDKWCYKVDGHSTSRLVEGIDSLLRESNEVQRVRKDIKKQIIYFALKLGDYLIHDVKVYGLWNYLRGKYVDKLGREDKYFHNSDVKLWEQKIQAVMGRGTGEKPERIVDAGVN